LVFGWHKGAVLFKRRVRKNLTVLEGVRTQEQWKTSAAGIFLICRSEKHARENLGKVTKMAFLGTRFPKKGKEVAPKVKRARYQGNREKSTFCLRSRRTGVGVEHEN
jgi:hypothetical protein